MDLRKGRKVEVFSRREVPAGSWRCAEIVSGNGHTYRVKYDSRLSDVHSAVERVPRKAIRPRPPPMEDSRAWAPGDIVDVFIDSSWVLSEVAEVIGNDLYVVRIVGCSKKLQVHALDIRARLSWQENTWVIIGEDYGKCYHGRINSIPKYETPALGTKKRPQIFFPAFDAYSRKIRAIEKVGRPQRLAAGHSFKFMEKVDAVVSPHNLFGEKYMHISNNKTIAHCEMDSGRFCRSTAGECCRASPLDIDDAESTLSSVCSCSVISSPCVVGNVITSSEVKNWHQHEVDSFCSSEREELHPTEETTSKEIHCLELLAYRSTLEALYASGPLSWDQESVMTNLRLMLHISNDEYLLELRRLVSAETNMPSR